MPLGPPPRMSPKVRPRVFPLPGKRVWVCSTHLPAAAETTEIGKSHKLRALFYGPYKVIRWRGPATLELDIPANVWPIKAKLAVFPISRVKPYKETEDIRELKKMGLVKIPDKAAFTDDYHYEVSKILGHKGTVGQKSAKYLVRWVGFDTDYKFRWPRVHSFYW